MSDNAHSTRAKEIEMTPQTWDNVLDRAAAMLLTWGPSWPYRRRNGQITDAIGDWAIAHVNMAALPDRQSAEGEHDE